MALGLLGEPSALKILRPMALNRNIMVFLQVAEARWRLGDEAALKDLVTASVSKVAGLSVTLIRCAFEGFAICELPSLARRVRVAGPLRLPDEGGVSPRK